MTIIDKMASISWSISKHEQLHIFFPLWRFHPIKTLISRTMNKALPVSWNLQELFNLWVMWTLPWRFCTTIYTYSIKNVFYSLCNLIQCFWVQLGDSFVSIIQETCILPYQSFFIYPFRRFYFCIYIFECNEGLSKGYQIIEKIWYFKLMTTQSEYMYFV
jgi:hypothetical protein